MSQHTPGPWTVDEALAEFSRVVSGPQNEVVAEVLSTEDEPIHVGRLDVERDANAHLIAAAPDLLAALEWALAWMNAYVETNPAATRIAANAAIHKAKGE